MRNKAKKYAIIVYALQGLSVVLCPLLFPLGLIGFIFNLIKKKEVKETIVESHFNWQIKTYGYANLGFLITLILSVIADQIDSNFINASFGIILYVIIMIWVVYRIFKGVKSIHTNNII